MSKKLLSLLLALRVAVSLAAVPATAAEDTLETVNECRAVRVEVDGLEYLVGFARTRNNKIDYIYDGGWAYDTYADENPDSEARYNFVFGGDYLSIGALAYYKPHEGAKGEWITAGDKIGIKVNGMTLTNIEGSAFSFSQYGIVTESDGVNTSLFWHKGHPGEAKVEAKIEITANGQTTPETVCLALIARDPNEIPFAFYTSADCVEDSRIPRNSRICYYMLPTPGKVWLKVEDGIEDKENVVVNPSMNQLTWQGNIAEITIPEPKNPTGHELNANYNYFNYNVKVEKITRPSYVSFGYENGECRVGFVESGFVDDGWLLSETTPFSENGRLVEWTQLQIAALIYADSGNFAAEGVTVGVTGMEISTLYGRSDAFSFSGQNVQLTTGEPEPTLYYREGAEAGALITAGIMISTPAGTWPATVSFSAYLETYGLQLYTSEDLSEESCVEYEETIGTELNYYNLPEPALWLHSDTPLSPEDLSVTTRSLSGDGKVGTLDWTILEDGYTARIDLKEPESVRGYSLEVVDHGTGESIKVQITNQHSGNALYVKLGDAEYAAGFIFNKSGLPVICEGDVESIIYSLNQTTNPESSMCGQLVLLGNVKIGVARKQRDANGGVYYTFENCPVDVRVDSFEIRYDDHVDADAEIENNKHTFSLSQDSEVTSLDKSSNTVSVFYREGNTARAVLKATVTLTVNGIEIRTGTVGVPMSINPPHEVTEETLSYTRPENDTVEALNAYMQTIVDGLPDDKEVLENISDIEFILTADSYQGTIEIPNALPKIRLCGGGRNGRTTVIGGVDTNGSRTVVNYIDFIAPKSDVETRAVYGGGNTEANDCTFHGYDVALNMSSYSRAPIRCVFADNGVALRIDLSAFYGASSGTKLFSDNAFVNNDTAVQVLNLNQNLTPYYFRVNDCNFVNNRVTFDVRAPGTFYFYRNFYGIAPGDTSNEIVEALKSQWLNPIFPDILTSIPVVHASNGARVITNPRWYFRVECGYLPSLSGARSGSSSSGAVMALAAEPAVEENYLTADWSLPTEIVVGEENLEISAEAFAGATEEDRVISVVEIDESGNRTELATWNFGKEAHSELADSREVFDASVNVTREDGSVEVEVAASSELLAALEPRLTIPDAFGGVTHEANGVPSGSGDGSVSFTVSDGGEYVISEANEVIPETPFEPSLPSTPVKPPVTTEPSEPESGSNFTDVVSGAWYCDAVSYVAENDLMEGTSATTFEPNANMTRAMVWTILARIDGETISGTGWAADARAWAMDNGVSDGTDTNGYVTREQLATMLWRYAGEPASDCSLAAFTDAESVSGYAAAAMAWAVENGIITGVTATTLVPQSTATRAQCAAMLMRFAEM